MLTILFFARIREQLEVDRLSVAVSFNAMTMADLLEQLIASHDDNWAEILMAANVVKAVNQQVVQNDHVLKDGDEVAFFPPVTGG